MSGPDKSLLDRLNALKGGSHGVSLDRSSNALNVSLTGIEPAKPSREDALATRLRSLRNTPEREEPPARQQQTPKSAGQHHPATRLSETASLLPATPSGGFHTAAPPQPRTTPSIGDPLSAPTTSDDVDPLLQTDDQTLEDLLADADLQFDQDPQQWGFDPKDESAKVNALLEELSKASPTQNAPENEGSSGGEKSREHDDDSDGEEMARKVETLFSQALDNAALNVQPRDVPDPPQASGKDQEAIADAHRQLRGAPSDDGQGDDDMGLSLPSVPSTLAAPKVNDDSGNDGLPGLSLPSVPSGAVQPKHDAELSFDSDIAARMAALGGLGTSSDGGMGLPSVPTFQPADRAVKRLTSKAGYTDEDADTWCTVCLEDATLQCLGCEDVYCARCWHEMHIGPAAAFDDRTHKAVRFVKPKKDQQRRVALGAS
ncbi:zinc fyve domain containing protein [Colletotrichum sojae]|uniref:Zinc fyve domain containing protein n=1 Tax=Colletotrichum sojae TaxID=2175907 RepID=A0A8H6JY51_9PEZI|nr:zinc fyve domain containing protein [Colletotrichum sojae]